MAILQSFLTQIISAIRTKNGSRLTELIVLDFDGLATQRQKPYADLHNELNQQYPKDNDAHLSDIVKNALSDDALAGFQGQFSQCLAQWLRYTRDFASSDNLAKARSIRQLTKHCITALGNNDYGYVMIPIVLSFTTTLGAIATRLDRNPSLTRKSTSSSGDTRQSFTEETAEVLQDALVKCLTSQASRLQPPSATDRRLGIYLTANAALRLRSTKAQLFAGATQMLSLLDSRSPLLNLYPASQRVTYLYFLGRYHFNHNHFYRAKLCLQTAYDQCHLQARKHRRLILIHLIASGMCIGRLPNKVLLLDPAAHDLPPYFRQLSQMIKSGDVGAFTYLMDITRPEYEAQAADWLLSRKIWAQLRSRCEPLVWRSLILHVFKHVGSHPGNGSERGRMPWLRLKSILHAALFSCSRATRNRTSTHTNGVQTQSQPFENDYGIPYISPDFADLSTDDIPYDTSIDPNLPTLDTINSIVLSLISQGFLHGFIQHNADDIGMSRFAIPGTTSAINKTLSGGTSVEHAWRVVGFPSIYDVVKRKALQADGSEGNYDETDGIVVPGWVTEGRVRGQIAEGSGGRVIVMDSARPAGM